MQSSLTIHRPKLTNYQKAILESPARFTVTEASTKAGKTFSHLWWLFESAHNPPKNGAHYWWVAPVYGQTEIAFNRLVRAIQANSLYEINRSKLYIKTPKGSYIHFKSAQDPDNLYGEDVYDAVFDEFTRAKEEAWHALRSTLTATNGRCKFIGNVKGKKNWGYKLAMRAKNGEQNFAYFKITAYDAVEAGILKSEEIEQARRDLPELVFKELYLAEASDDGTNPFGIRFIRNQISALSDKPAVCYGVDLAKSVDWTVITGLDSECRVCHHERFQRDWKQTREQILRLPDVRITIDSTGVGDPVVEDIQRIKSDVVGFKYSSQSKQQIMESLAVAIQQSEIWFPEEYVDELECFEFEYTRTGVRYTAPQGVHDDCVNSLALAYSGWRKEQNTYDIDFVF